MTTMSEALAGCLAGQPDVPDDMFELLTAMVVDDGCPAVSEWLLQHKELPLRLAQKLVDRRGVSAVELTAFASREDMPAATLQEWVRKERRVTVLAQIAAKPDLPQEVFEVLATRKGTELQAALLFNESAPVDVRAGIAADLLVADRMSYDDRCDLRSVLDGSELLQPAVFDRLSPDVLLKHVKSVSKWDGLTVSQLHSLLEAVERHAAAIPSYTADADWQVRNKIDEALQQALAATRCLAEHPSADEALLDRLETFADAYPACWPRTLDETVTATRQRLALLGDYCGPLHSAPYSKLVEFADTGVLCEARTAQRAIRNPLFDADVAVRILEAGTWLADCDYNTERLLHAWSPDLLVALRLLRMKQVPYPPPYPPRLSELVAAASTDELLDALGSVADDPAWGLRLAQEIAAAGVDDDEVVGRFGWFPDHVAATGTRCRVGALTVDYLYRRFGAHRPAWQVFGSVADPSTSLADAAALAVHAEPATAAAADNPGTAGA